jgi:uncharacterized membrane protein YfcA
VSLKALRILCATVFVCGIVGLIVGSVVDNNGTVITVGIVIVVAAVSLLAASSVVQREPIDAFVEAEAERLEASVQQLVAAGAPEPAVRDLVREAMRIGRSR